jgi:nicotinamidase-related amidase
MGRRWIEISMPFLEYLDDWYGHAEKMNLSGLLSIPDKVALVSVDVTNGFCHEGPLASERVKTIIEPITRLMTSAWSQGVRNIVLTQDTHHPDAVEFNQYVPHCIRGTNEAEAVPEIKSLPFFDQIAVFEKNSIDSGMSEGFLKWLARNPQIECFIVVGDCTDLCTYQLAMHLRLEANEKQLKRRVILPIDCVDTYDLPVPVAKDIGAVPHDAGLLHRVFLYSMMLNGIEIVSSLS